MRQRDVASLLAENENGVGTCGTHRRATALYKKETRNKPVKWE